MIPGSLTGAGKISDIEGNVNGSIGARDARPDLAGVTLTLNAKAINSIHRCTVAAIAANCTRHSRRDKKSRMRLTRHKKGESEGKNSPLRMTGRASARRK
jgi:hypothetical protein